VNVARRPGRCLGLIGGLGPGATVHYYRELVAAHEREGRSLRILIAHAEIERVYAAVNAEDLDGLARYFTGMISDMAAGGAEFTAIVAATAHICARELAALSRLPLINMLTEVRHAVDTQGLRRVGLLGTRFTIESRMFGCLEGIETIMPDGARIERIHELYKEFVDGRGSDAKADELRKIARQFVSRDGAQSVLIAGTDLSNVFTDSNAGFPMIDCARVHIDAIVRRLLD
jgi:aspartate racemase